MAIDSVNNISSLLNVLNTTGSSTTENTGTNFSDLLKDAIGQVENVQTKNDVNSLQLLSGQSTDIHTSLITAQKAELTFNLAVQVRNKVIDAYNEVMRMQL
ncbi:MAG TPA: flagellar hook-basal body complex protein FliE [Clostridia bacterium]|nr:flagellar hook-basal body complex protein FliE [Clostridia bacterium]